MKGFLAALSFLAAAGAASADPIETLVEAQDVDGLIDPVVSPYGSGMRRST